MTLWFDSTVSVGRDASAGFAMADDGAFSFEHLSPGTYTIAAGEPSWVSGGYEPAHALGRLTGLVLGEGETISDLELHLTPGGTIEGQVMDRAGAPAAGATISIWDAQGRVLNDYGDVVTDGAGRFIASGLAAGDWTVNARRGHEASPASSPLGVSPRSSVKTRLALGAGTSLRVVAVGADGQPVDAAVSVRDPSGREHADVPPTDTLLLSVGAITSAGPLPPGTYTVRARSRQSEWAEVAVTLNGEPEHELTLKLGE